MKKLLIFVIYILLFLIKLDGQIFEPTFLGEDFLQYKGVFFKLNENTSASLSYCFYDKLEYCQSLYDDRVLYPSSKYKFNTEKDSLKNRIFIIENIINKNGMIWDNKITYSYNDQPLLILKDTLTKQIIYYKYDKQNEFDFPFNTSKIKYNKIYFCSKINRQIDDFTGEIRINSPVNSPIVIWKIINNNKICYYLDLTAYGNTANVNKLGVIILFTDGTKWIRSSSKIDVKVGDYGFEYSSFINLIPIDLILFSSKKIKKFRLYIYDVEFSLTEADIFKSFVKYIKESK